MALGSVTAAHAAEKVEVPKLVGQSADDARDQLKDLGFKVKLKAKPKKDGPVFLASNWTVTKQSVKAGKKAKVGKKITLTVKKKPLPTAAPSPTEAAAETPDPKLTSAGLNDIYAASACDQYGRQAYPYGFKGHTILGLIASENQGDHYFVKFEADITNAFNAKASYTVDCMVGGSNDAPQVTSFDVY